jgi:hypothetical protein
MLAGMFMAFIFMTFPLLAMRALRDHNAAPSLMWSVPLSMGVGLLFVFLDLHFRGAHTEAFFKDAIVAAGTVFVVMMAVGGPVFLSYALSMGRATTNTEREAWLDQNNRDLAKWLIGAHIVLFLFTVTWVAAALIWPRLR